MFNPIWASMWENLSSGDCNQQRRRPACASAQSDQHLYYLLIWKYDIQTCYERNFNFLASLCSCKGWFKTPFVGNPEDMFSGGEVHTKPDHGRKHQYTMDYQFWASIYSVFKTGYIMLTLKAPRKKCIWKCRLLKSSAANNCLTLLTN